MQDDNRETEIEVSKMESKRKLLSDKDCLVTIKDLLIIQKFTYNENIIVSIDLIIWELIIDQLKKSV